ncbi:MAG TPA: SRPBCC domain-containing protein [Bryobacteraceae bacterium]|nr:SRPBCC domain-containing protein [Bryobacteraceae bacterium]
MPVVEIHKDPEALTMTVIAQFAAPVARVWNAYADPRQLERFWGPPSWPAKFVRHDFVVGGRSEYYMSGPNGERSGGYFEFVSVDEPRSFEVKDGFLGEDGRPAEGMPSMTMRFTFEPHEGGTRMVTLTTFPSVEAMEQLLKMGMEEGMKSAMGQIDAVLAAG